MGNLIACKCRNCEHRDTFRLGGGRFSYLTNCPVPAINIETLEFEKVNFYEHEKSGKYMFYSNEVLKGDNYDNKTFTNFKLIFNEEGNYCPKCKEKKLAFRVAMYLD